MTHGESDDRHETQDGPRPRFSIVTAVYNVHRYLPDFIASIEAQDFDLSRVEVIAVDDGSTDDSLQLLRSWEERRPGLVRVLAKENGGQGSARNLGMTYARGEWVTLPDPDDMLEPEYLSSVDRFLTRNPSTTLVATNRIFLRDATGKISDTHPLKLMFLPGDQLVDLNRFPEYFHGSAPASFFRTDVIQEAHLQFDARVQPNFEDGHFCTHYLLLAGAGAVGFLKSARYIYRTRADGTSTLQGSLRDPRRFTDVPRYGYLDVLTRGAELNGGHAPEWVQNFVIYELTFYFSSDLAANRATAVRGEVAETFLAALREIAARLDPYVVQGFKVRALSPIWRDILLHGLSGEPWVTDYAVTQVRDVGRSLVRIAYRFVGDAPQETVLAHGIPYDVEYGKIRSHEFFGTTLLRERLAWVPLAGSLRILLDGKPVKLQPGWEPIHNTTVRPVQVQNWFEEKQTGRATPRRPQRRTRLTAGERAILLAARLPAVRARYAGAWVLQDRVHDADDNGERLFRYLRTERRDINAWFVLERGTPDWERLVRDGFGDRLVAHGSRTWKLLMMHCVNLISSHADLPVHRPPAIMRLRGADWNFSFLQHGVIKDDLSRWLNPKQLDLFVTSTPQEQASIAGDDTPYVYTNKEARMTGLPRFDRLLALGSAVPQADRKVILVCPTWRQWLHVVSEQGGQRAAVSQDFLDSEYVRMWTAFLSDDRLRELAEKHDLRVGFLPHPNIQPALPQLALPDHVEALTFAGNDVQQLMAECALMVTDYSSMAFNAAYLDRPVVYFQFDAQLLLEGAHVGRQGYFDYVRDGFGPVTAEVAETVEQVVGIVEAGAQPAPQYQQRIDLTFTERDGRCCERTTAAIEELTVPGPQPSLARRAVSAAGTSPRMTRLARSAPLRRVRPRVERLVRSTPVRRLVK